jgi:hypothetical protein
MSKVLLEMSMSLDGYVTVPDVIPQEPMARRGERLHATSAGTVAWATTQKVDAVPATVLDASMSPRSKRPAY